MRFAPLVLVGGLLVVAACGDDGGGTASSTTEAACREAVGGRVTIVAADLAFDTDCLAIPADQGVVIEVDNRDEGVNHNLSIGAGPKTDLETGPVVQELDVRLAEGTYGFVCDIHPNMTGELQVS